MDTFDQNDDTVTEPTVQGNQSGNSPPNDDVVVPAEFLAALYDSADVKKDVNDLRALPSRITAYAPIGSLSDVAKFLRKNRKENLYFGVATRRDRTGRDLANCARLTVLFVDIDFKTTPEGKARKLLTAFKYKPSIIVTSGGGWHVYWLLDVPIDLQTGAETAKAALRRLAVAVGGDLSSAEPAHILRLPGTLNYKYDPPRQVIMLDSDPSRRYALNDLLAVLPADPTPPTGGRFEMPGTVEQGMRSLTLFRAARSMKTKGMSPEAVLAALRVTNQERCVPPLPDENVQQMVDNAFRQADRPGFEPRDVSASQADASKDAGNPPEGEVASPQTALRLPEEAYIGLGKEFADLFAQYLESPRAFLYISFLTYVGASIAQMVTLDSQISPQPRLYAVLLGESGDTRKSTALTQTKGFFEGLPGFNALPILGIGSAEGLARGVEENPRVVLEFDELKTFTDKAKRDGSVMLPCVNTLFEKTEYENYTKDKILRIPAAYLSMLAACTTDTYSNMFDPSFFAIGFLNRLFIVADESTPRFALPPTIPAGVIAELREKVSEMLLLLNREYMAQPVTSRMAPRRLPVDDDARAMLDEWYFSRDGSIFEKRLDTYAQRLMILLAVTSGKDRVDVEVMRAVLAMVRYQLLVRRECDPVDAENTIAKVEESIRRQLRRGSLTGVDLRRRTNATRVGIWMYEKALANLMKVTKEVAYSGGRYALASSPTSSPTSGQNAA